MLGYLSILSVLAVGVLGRPELYTRCHVGERFDDVSTKCVSDLLRFDEARARPNCPFNQTIAIVIPHESDCDKFYYCVNGILTVINCPVGTEFDPSSGTCNWPTEGGCYSKTTTTTEATTVTDPTTTTTTTTTVAPTTEDCDTTVVVTTTPTPNITTTAAPEKPICPQNTTSISIIPSPTECNKFYVCVSGLGTEYTCEAGNEFDPTVQNCVPISSEGCFASQVTTTPEPTTLKTTTPEPTTPEPTTPEPTTPEPTTPEPTTPEPTTPEPTTPESTTPEPTTPEPTTQTPTTLPPPICPQNTTSVSIIPSPSECDKFYVCLAGAGTEYTCATGTEFDPAAKDCVPISPSGCYATQAATTPEPTTPEPTTPVPTTEEPTTPVPTTEEPTTPVPTTEEPTTPVPTTEEPTTPEPTTQAPTTLPPPICPQNTTSISFVPSPESCDKFYICIAGSGTEYTCESGKEFDPASKDCVPISPGGCFASQMTTAQEPSTPEPTTTKATTPVPTTEEPSTPAPTTEEPSTPAPTTEEPSTPVPTTEEPSTPVPTTEPPTTPVPTTEVPTTPVPTTEEPTTPEPTTQAPTTIPPPICPQNTSSISFVPSPAGCDKFYICVAGSGTEYTCESGKEFDPASKDCVPISSNGCFASQMTTTEPPTTPVPTTEEPTTPEPTTQAPTTIPPPICPQNTSSISFVPSPAGCDKFYICVAGSGTEYTCESGKEFDPASKDCVPISSEGCFASQDKVTSTPSSNMTTPNASTPLPPISTSGTDSPCESICQSTTSYWPDSDDCRNFWSCKDGLPVLESCVTGLKFDSIIRQCTYSVLANCVPKTNKLILA